MTEMQKSFSDQQQANMQGMAQLGTQQKAQQQEAGFRFQQLQLEREKLGVGEEQSALDRELQREMQVLNSLEGVQDRSFQADQAGQQRLFQSDQAGKQRTFQAGQSELDRIHSSSESALDRDQRDQLVAKEIEARTEQTKLEADLRKKQQDADFKRQVEYDAIRREAALNAMEVDTDEIRERLEQSQIELDELTDRRLAAEAIAAGKEDDFLLARTGMGLELDKKANFLEELEDNFASAFENGGVQGLLSDVKTQARVAHDEEADWYDSIFINPWDMDHGSGSLLKDFGKVVANLSLSDNNQYLIGQDSVLANGLDLYLEGNTGKMNASNAIATHIGESMAHALGRAEIADDLSGLVGTVLLAASRGSTPEEYSKIIKGGMLTELEVDEETFHQVLKIAQEQMAEQARTFRSSSTGAVSSEDLPAWMMVQVYRQSGLSEAVGLGPDIRSSSYYRSRADQIRSSSTIGQIGLIEDQSDLDGLIDMLSEMDTGADDITDITALIRDAERAQGRMAIDAQIDIRDLERDAARSAFDIEKQAIEDMLDGL